MFTCSCSVKVEFLGEVLEIRELSLYNIHDVTEEGLFSVCSPSVFQLEIRNDWFNHLSGQHGQV